MKTQKLILSIALFMLCLSVSGCGEGISGDGLESASENGELSSEGRASHWKSSHFSMPAQYEDAVVEGDRIYTCRYVETGAEVSVFDADGVEPLENYELLGVTEVKNISVDDSGQICLLGSAESGNALWRIGPDGEIDVMENIELENMGLDPVLKNFYVDRNGYYYLWYEMGVPWREVYQDDMDEDIYTRVDRIYVKDQQMNTIVYEQVPYSSGSRLLYFDFDEEGSPMLFAEDPEGYYVRRVRTEDREEYGIERLENIVFPDLAENVPVTFTREGMLYTREGALYLYRKSEAREEKLLELAGAGLLEEGILYLGMEDGAIEIIDNYPGIRQSEYTILTEGENDKMQLTLGVMSLDAEMQKAVASFNRYQNEVEIEPVVYMESGDWDYDAGYQRLILDVVQDKGPDLVDVSGLDYENLARLGAFSDLYAFLGEDEELTKEDFVSSVLGAYEMNGHLYTIAPGFLIFSMWGAESTVEGREGLNTAELIQTLQSRGGDINSIYGFSADEDPLTTLCALGMDEFIDWEEGTCDFMGKEFRQTLAFAKEYKGPLFDSLYRAIRDGDILLTCGIITCVEDYRLESELYGEDIQFIGYPTESGIGSAVQFTGDCLAINSESKHQEAAWEFIKYYLQNGYNGTSFPILQKRFESFLDASLEEIFAEEEGESVKVAKKSYVEKDVAEFRIYRCEPEDVEAIRDLVNRIDTKFQYHTVIQEIIDEEVPAYFQGQKEMEEVCDIIQSKVQIYLNER